MSHRCRIERATFALCVLAACMWTIPTRPATGQDRAVIYLGGVVSRSRKPTDDEIVKGLVRANLETLRTGFAAALYGRDAGTRIGEADAVEAAFVEERDRKDPGPPKRNFLKKLAYMVIDLKRFWPFGKKPKLPVPGPEIRAIEAALRHAAGKSLGRVTIDDDKVEGAVVTFFGASAPFTFERTGDARDWTQLRKEIMDEVQDAPGLDRHIRDCILQAKPEVHRWDYLAECEKDEKLKKRIDKAIEKGWLKKPKTSEVYVKVEIEDWASKARQKKVVDHVFRTAERILVAAQHAGGPEPSDQERVLLADGRGAAKFQVLIADVAQRIYNEPQAYRPPAAKELWETLCNILVKDYDIRIPEERISAPSQEIVDEWAEPLDSEEGKRALSPQRLNAFADYCDNVLRQPLWSRLEVDSGLLEVDAKQKLIARPTVTCQLLDRSLKPMECFLDEGEFGQVPEASTRIVLEKATDRTGMTGKPILRSTVALRLSKDRKIKDVACLKFLLDTGPKESIGCAGISLKPDLMRVFCLNLQPEWWGPLIGDTIHVIPGEEGDIRTGTGTKHAWHAVTLYGVSLVPTWKFVLKIKTEGNSRVLWLGKLLFRDEPFRFTNAKDGLFQRDKADKEILPAGDTGKVLQDFLANPSDFLDALKKSLTEAKLGARPTPVAIEGYENDIVAFQLASNEKIEFSFDLPDDFRRGDKGKFADLLTLTIESIFGEGMDQQVMVTARVLEMRTADASAVRDGKFQAGSAYEAQTASLPQALPLKELSREFADWYLTALADADK